MIALAYALALASASGAPGITRVEWAQLTIRRRVIIRVPAGPPPKATRIRWVEKKGPKCIPLTGLAAAAITRPDAVDLVLRGGTRLRAQLADECPAIDYYSGFYLLPSADGMVCADRDAIHSRAGGRCQIERFRTLVPAKER